ncbi:MAG: outer membrane beta-barrel family protein [Bacteroidales bacterium]|nr:outer membrane beta-barrel family protein [Bacteroidales bacterium]MDT8432681.1 outer membrane beta-barrel family protein [Bacteroidales bacterium]
MNAAFSEGDGVAPYTDSRFTAYPSAFLTYSPGEKNQFQFSYSRRVDRPGISQMNPIRTSWSSPLTTFVGNPELEPQYTNSIEINYSRGTGIGMISVGTFYRRINDNIIRYTNPDPFEVNKTLVTYDNAEGENRYGAEFSAMVRPVKWWNINASSDVYYQTMTGYAFGEQVEVESVATNVRINNSFSVSDAVSIQLFAMYRGAREVIQYKFGPMYMVNAGFSWDILKDQGTISFRVNDIFNTLHFRLEATNYYATRGEFFWESRTANLSFSYRFKSGEVKIRKRGQRDSREMDAGEGF